MQKMKVAIMFLALMIIACRASTRLNENNEFWREESIRVGETQRWFRVYARQDLAEESPVVVLLHGGTQSMRKIFRENAGGSQAWLDVAEEEEFLLLVPNGTNTKTGDTDGDRQNWNDLRPTKASADDVAFINEMLDWAQEHYPIDPQRIYVTGASNGGMMTYRLLIETPERFAAGVAFIASFPDDPALLSQPEMATPLMIVSGTEDPLVKWEGGKIRSSEGGEIMSAEDNLAWWLTANQANPQAAITTQLPDNNQDDGCQLHQTVYPAGDNGATIVFIRMNGGGHAMPSIKYEIFENMLVDRLIGPVCKDIEGAQLAWTFMREFQR